MITPCNPFLKHPDELQTLQSSIDHIFFWPLSTIVKMPHSATLNDILHHAEIIDMIFLNLSLANTMWFSRVAHLTCDMMKIRNTMMYSIHTLLRPFFDCPVGFRCLQAHMGTLISGCNTLNFFDGMRYRDSHLDLYMHMGHAKEVGLWIIAEGYEYQPISANTPQNYHDCRFDAWRPLEMHWDSAQHIPGLDADQAAVWGVCNVHHFVQEGAEGKQEIMIMAFVYSPMQSIMGSNSSESTIHGHCHCLTHVFKLAPWISLRMMLRMCYICRRHSRRKVICIWEMPLPLAKQYMHKEAGEPFLPTCCTMTPFHPTFSSISNTLSPMVDLGECLSTLV